MDLEIINRLYLELSQVATAKTAREIALEDKLEQCRFLVVECKGDTLDRVSPAIRRQAAALFNSVFSGHPGAAAPLVPTETYVSRMR